MKDNTRQALTQAFRHLASLKNVDEITIQGLCQEAHKSRMTFYYHFRDINDLMEWMFNETAQHIISKHKDHSSSREALTELVHYVYKEKDLMINIYNSVSYEALEHGLNSIISSIIKGILSSSHYDSVLSTQENQFLLTIFTHGLTGVCLDWVKEGFKESPELIISQLSLACDEFLKGSVLILNKQK